MVRRRLIGVRFACLVLMTGFVTWPTAAQADPPTSVQRPPVARAPVPAVRQAPTQSLEALPAPLSQEAIEEILRLRRALGVGGVVPSNAKEGTAVAPDDQFRQALLTLAGQSSYPLPAPVQPTRPLPIDNAPPVVEPTTEPPRVVELFPAQPSASETADAILASSTADLAIVVSLRNTSRQLDSRAHDLDAEQRFDEAEKLRQLAARLRKDARRIESTALAHGASVSSS